MPACRCNYTAYLYIGGCTNCTTPIREVQLHHSCTIVAPIALIGIMRLRLAIYDMYFQLHHSCTNCTKGVKKMVQFWCNFWGVSATPFFALIKYGYIVMLSY